MLFEHLMDDWSSLSLETLNGSLIRLSQHVTELRRSPATRSLADVIEKKNERLQKVFNAINYTKVQMEAKSSEEKEEACEVIRGLEEAVWDLQEGLLNLLQSESDIEPTSTCREKTAFANRFVRVSQGSKNYNWIYEHLENSWTSISEATFAASRLKLSQHVKELRRSPATRHLADKIEENDACLKLLIQTIVRNGRKMEAASGEEREKDEEEIQNLQKLALNMQADLLNLLQSESGIEPTPTGREKTFFEKCLCNIASCPGGCAQQGRLLIKFISFNLKKSMK